MYALVVLIHGHRPCRIFFLVRRAMRRSPFAIDELALARPSMTVTPATERIDLGYPHLRCGAARESPNRSNHGGSTNRKVGGQAEGRPPRSSSR